MKHHTLTPLQSSIIDNNIDEIKRLRSFKKIKPFLKDMGLDITQTQLYDYLNPDNIIDCARASFVSYSVGYKACAKGCDCYVANLSKKVSAAKLAYTDEKKAAVANKRRESNRRAYGVDSVFQKADVVEKIKDTKLSRYGTTGFNNRVKARETCIASYGVENPAQTDEVQQKIQNTNIARYGVGCPLVSDEVQARAKETLFERYGVHTTFDSPEIRAKIDATNLQRYGTTMPVKSDAVRGKIARNLRSALYDRMISSYTTVRPLFTKEQYLSGVKPLFQCSTCGRTIDAPIVNGQVPRCLTCLPYSVSVFEKSVRDFVGTLYSGDIEYNTRAVITPYELDIYFPDLQFGIECNGVYRHTEVVGNKAKDYHLNKTQMCESKGISLLHITDHLWEERTEIVKSMIRYKLGLCEKYHARSGTVCRIHDTQTVKDFLNANHLQGYTHASINYGLYINGELMSVMTFAKPRFSPEQYEIIRFCSKTGVSIVGAAGKLLSKFKRDFQPSSIITYSDRSYGLSEFYGTLGFTFSHASAPGYMYYKDAALYNRMQFQKHKLAEKLPIYDAKKTEWENMQTNGYDRIWDCGVKVWKWFSG